MSNICMYIYIHIHTMCALFLRNKNGLSPGGCANMDFFLTAWRKKTENKHAMEKSSNKCSEALEKMTKKNNFGLF